MQRPPQPSSLDNWDVPPPTDGPNARFRRAQGLPLYSGTSAPLPVPSMAREGVQQQSQRNVYTAEEWREWQRVQQQGREERWPGEGEQQPYHSFEPTVTSSAQQLYYEIDPSLPLPSPADLQRSYAAYADAQPPQLYDSAPNSTSYNWEERQRQASSATVIDHGSPPSSPSSPAFEGLPELNEEMIEPPLFSKEEWLRLGGFAPIEPQKPSVEPPRQQSAPPMQSQTNAEGGWGELPSPRYSFPSTLQPFNPADIPYSHAQQLPPAPFDLPPLPPLPELPSLAAPSPFPEQGCPFAQSDLRSTNIGRGRQDDIAVDSSGPSLPLPRTRKRTAPSSSTRSHNRLAPYPSQNPSFAVSATDLPPSPLDASLSSFSAHPPPALPPLNEHRKSHARKRSIGHITRPRNAFILFRSHAVSTNLIPRDLGIKNEKNISQVVATVWRSLPPEEKRHWELLAEEEKRAHKEKYPEYVFKPKQKGPRKPVGQGKKALAKKARIKEEEEEDEDAFSDDEEEYVPQPRTRTRTRTGRQHKPKSMAAPQPFAPKEMPETTARKMQLLGEALAEGEIQQRIEDRVKLEMQLEEELGIPPPSKPEKPRYPRRRQPLNVEPSTLPLPPSNPSTPRKTRASTRPAPYTSPSSDILVNSPASSTSTASPSRDHSFRQTRLAKRGGTSTWISRGGDASPSASSPSSSPQRQQQAGSGISSPVKSPLSQSTTSQRPSKGYGQLGVASSSASTSSDNAQPTPQFIYPSFEFGKSPFLAGRAFDNSPLLGGPGADRKSSLGRWELRKPSVTMSRREMMAQEEETMEFGPGGRTISKAFTIDPQLFLAEAGLEEETDYSSNYLPTPPPPPPHFSTPIKPLKPSPPTSAYTKHATYALPPVEYHYGGQDLFSAPSNDLFGGKMAKGRNGSGGSGGSGGGGQPSAMDFGLQLDERGSTYSEEASIVDQLEAYR